MKRFYEKLLLMLLFVVAGNVSVRAEHLTPEEALRRAVTECTMHDAQCTIGASPLNLKPSALSLSMQLAFTQRKRVADEAAVYVFNNTSGRPGFLVVAADDRVGNIVLGSSDESTFDPANVPPAMQWLLGAYAEYVEECANKAEGLGLKAEKGIIGANPLSLKSSALSLQGSQNRRDIAPLVSCNWNQYGPFWDNCPEVDGGRRCLTGCVATAMAQIMYYHKWPAQGVGSYTHKFTYKDVEYTTSANFGATTYDWANMVDRYNTGSNTAAQNEAVAVLMHHCGVASRMDYTPASSGASDLFAGRGMIDFFKYDPSMKLLHRDWFTAEEWDEMVYEQLANNMPMLYAGYTANYGGHEFVCDGYRTSDGCFHINWGWGGGSNGYFMLRNLKPGSQGAGGAPDGGGFNQAQSILCNIRPYAGGAIGKVLYTGGVMTDMSEYYMDEGVRIIGSVLSNTLQEVEFEIYLEFDYGNGRVEHKKIATKTIAPQSGYGLEAPLAATEFPKGEYDVRWAYKNENGDIVRAYADLSADNDYLHFIVDNQEIRVTHGGEPVHMPEGWLETYGPADGEDDIYAGHSCEFTYSFKCDDKWEGELVCIVFEGKQTELNFHQILASSGNVKMTISDDELYQRTMRVDLPETLEAGTYSVALAYVEGDKFKVITTIDQITVRRPLAHDAFVLPTYTLCVDRGYLPADTEQGKATKGTSPAEAGRYALLRIPNTTKELYYLYNTDNGMFVKSADFESTYAFLAQPDGEFQLTPIQGTEKFIISSAKSGHYLQLGGANQLLVNNWNRLDAGNQWTITERGKFDARDVYNALGWMIPTRLVAPDYSVLAAPAVYNLNGQRVSHARRGLYIIDGKKVLMP